MTRRVNKKDTASTRDQTRGYVEIHGGPICGFAVYDWSEHGDSGYEVGHFWTYPKVARAAFAWARGHNRRVPEADVLPFPEDAS